MSATQAPRGRFLPWTDRGLRAPVLSGGSVPNDALSDQRCQALPSFGSISFPRVRSSLPAIDGRALVLRIASPFISLGSA